MNTTHCKFCNFVILLFLSDGCSIVFFGKKIINFNKITCLSLYMTCGRVCVCVWGGGGVVCCVCVWGGGCFVCSDYDSLLGSAVGLIISHTGMIDLLEW